MKVKLLEWIVCPECKKSLHLDVFTQKKDDIQEASLSCDCGAVYPVINGVPRILSKPLWPALLQHYGEYFSKYSAVFDLSADHEYDSNTMKAMKTIERFGYEWNQFSDYNCQNFSHFIESLPEGFFRGKLGLDVGCGAGRHANEATKLGAETIGVDLSYAVDAAQSRAENCPRLHIVQADVFNLPFKDNLFDFIYSLGVIQHLKDPRSGFTGLCRFLRDKGSIFVWVYSYSLRKAMLEFLRLFSMKMSNKSIKTMAFVCNLVDYGIFVNVYKLLSTLPGLVKIIDRSTPLRIKEYAGHGYKVSLVDWFDRLSAPITNYYKKPEMLNWLSQSGLDNTKLRPIGDSWWYLFGERPAKL